MRLVAAALVIAVALTAASCGGGSGSGRPAQVVDGKITIPHGAVSALERFKFTTQLDVEAADGDYALTFDGAFQKPDSVQGTLRLAGKFLEDFAWLKRPLDETEIVNVGAYAWWREPGGVWQPGIAEGYEISDPLIYFRQYATPYFYLDALLFDTLSLPVSGEAEEVNGVRSIPVTLDKRAIIDVLGQGGDVSMYPDETHEPITPPRPNTGIMDNAQQVLPKNFTVNAWFAEKDLHPSRIVFEYDLTNDDMAVLTFGFRHPFHLRLQMDITDPDADVDIEPIDPIPTLTPTPTTEPGEFEPGQAGLISEIAASDRALDAIGDVASIAIADAPWRTSALVVLGGYVTANFRGPKSYEGPWPEIVYDETSDPPFREVTRHYRVDNMTQMRVLVYLPERRVVQIRPADGTISPPQVFPTP